jgi:hypothetical protein
VSTLTSPGLDELKQLINDATARHGELRAELAAKTNALDRAVRRLRRAQFFIIRLFTEKAIPRLVDAANQASDELDETRAHLEGCFVEVDFAFDDRTRESYAALIRAFESLRSAQRIWDITATAAVDRVRQRTTAFNAITRIPVSFGFANSEIIRSQYPAMRLGNVGGRDLQIYPGFALMRDASRDFALIEFPQFDCQLAQSRFIEEETVPSDAEQVGATWKRANKDGSRDRRFNSNYQIPVMRYGALAFSSPTGLAEVYQISSYEKAAGFARAIAAHKSALANLKTPGDLPALAAPTNLEEELPGEDSQIEPTFAAKPRKNLLVDWLGLVLLLVGLGMGSFWTVRHRNELVAAITPAPPSTPPPAASAAPAPSPAAAPTASHSKARRHHKHHRRVVRDN